jgi:hypothetical protein
VSVIWQLPFFSFGGFFLADEKTVICLVLISVGQCMIFITRSVIAEVTLVSGAMVVSDYALNSSLSLVLRHSDPALYGGSSIARIEPGQLDFSCEAESNWECPE